MRARLFGTTVLLAILPLGCNTLVGNNEVSVDGEPIQKGGVIASPNANANSDGVAGPTVAVNCSYAPVSIGVGEGKQLPATLSFKGYAAGSDEVSELYATAAYDCNGSKQIHATVYDISKWF